MKLVSVEGHSEEVEILVFNYDGHGNALVRYKGSEYPEHCDIKDLKDILLGGNNEERKYKLQ